MAEEKTDDEPLQRTASLLFRNEDQGDDYFWTTQWEDDFETDALTNGNNNNNLVDCLPPQLHPAVSLGMHRVSSCAYFSLQGSVSEADLHSLSSEYVDVVGLEPNRPQEVDSDQLYHDIMMHVFTFLDARSLAAFSETARRCNFECFYFLQLQLQRALLEDDFSVRLNQSASPCQDDDQLAAIAGSWTISRLASLDKQEAKEVVQEYLDSNTTLKTMPLSHSLAYIRQVLRRNGFSDQTQQAQALTASAAVLIGLVGAATVMTGNVNVEVVESFGTELPNMIFKVGFVGSLMSAARHQWEAKTATTRPTRETSEVSEADSQIPEETGAQSEHSTQQSSSVRETAEHMAAHFLQHVGVSATLEDGNASFNSSSSNAEGRQEADSSISRRMYHAFRAASGQHEEVNNEDEETDNLQTSVVLSRPLTPDPYEHVSIELEESKQGELTDDLAAQNVSESTGSNDETGALHRPKGSVKKRQQKMPSGCVGAYRRAIHRATESITHLVKAQRRERYDAQPDNEILARSFIDACCSDNSLDVVKDMVQKRGVVDADGFYVGSDGTQTCALHASAFHGATKCLEFLCGGIDERDPSKDEGLCGVNLQDVNGWTALHFAAGANCVDSVRILAERGAKLDLIADNGYTPLQWAQRLCNHEVAEELRRRLEEHDRTKSSNHPWIAGASQPLSMIAHRFFAMIPSQ